MKYFSTRSGSERVSAAEAIIRGLAPDGGLYVPESIPCLSPDDFAELCELDYRERAARVMAPFLGEFTPEEVRRDLEGMQTMRTLGNNMAHLLNSLEKAALPLPEEEPRVATNFIS